MVNVILTLRIVQAVLAIIVLGLAAYVVDFYNRHGYSFGAASFLVFDSIWTFVALGYLVATPMFFPTFHNRWAVLGVEAITMVFWFAGFIALAADIPSTLRCVGDFECPIPAARAAAAFGAFEWLAWAGTLGLVVHALIQYRKGDPGDGIETGITNPTGAPDGDVVIPSGLDVEMNGPQFENRIDQHDQHPSEAPYLPQLSELAARDLGLQDQLYGHPPIDGSGTLEMPDVGQYGGNATYVEQSQ